MGARTRGLANNVLTSGKLDATDAISGVIPADNIANASLTSATTFGSVTGGVPAVSSDPPSPSEGDIWYNTTLGKLRFRSQIGAWSTGGNLNTGRRGVGLGTLGTQTAALCVSGALNTPGNNVTNVESYDGSTWTEVNDVNTNVRYGAASGTQSSAIKYTGQNDPQTVNVESWNGSSWTEVGNVNNARSSISGAGADNTTAIAMSGYNNPPGSLAYVETWNGSSWTETTDVNTARWGGGSLGLTNDGILVGGYTTTALGNVESWNGSAWTEVADLNTAGYEGAAAGTTTDGLYYAGSNRTGNTEAWNGSAWTEVADIGNTFGAGGGGGSALAAISYAGNPASYNDDTYEWNKGAGNLDVTLS